MSSPLPWDRSPLPRLEPRPRQSHKGHYGHLLVLGGSRGMAGAVALAGMAALRSGTGLVTLAVPREVQPVVAAFEPAYMVWPLDCDQQGRFTLAALEQLEPLLGRATALALGPGLGRGGQLEQLVLRLYTRLELPLVVDADGLNALAAAGLPRQAPHSRVLTPHPGEFARLTGLSTAQVAQDRPGSAWRFACQHQVVLVLKGHRSIVCDPQHVSENLTGNPGMATGGTGDVLTGVVGALLAQGLPPYQAARLAAFVHGKAGDLAAGELGEISLTATDLLDFLPPAWESLAG